MTSAAPYEIRRAAKSDARAVERCLREAFEPYRKDYTPAAFADTVPALLAVERRIISMICLVADSGREIVGTLTADGQAHPEGHLRGMAVRAQWQGSGVADLLLEEALRSLTEAGCEFATLDTTRPLTRAVKFYERHGFAATGRVRDYFGMRLYEYKKVLDE